MKKLGLTAYEARSLLLVVPASPSRAHVYSWRLRVSLLLCPRSFDADGVSPVSRRHHCFDSESGWDESAQSHRGAVGLMQLMPDTATDMISKGIVNGTAYSVDDLTDPEVNIEFGTAYLSYLLSYFDGNVDRAIAAYNAGLANVDYWSSQGGALHNAITYPETQAYLVRVQNAQERYQELYGDRF